MNNVVQSIGVKLDKIKKRGLKTTSTFSEVSPNTQQPINE